MIYFDLSSHTYWLGGSRLPSVTEVLKPLFGDLRYVDQDLLDYKSDLGRAVHRAVELHVQDDLQYDSLDPRVAAMFDQYLQFEADTGFIPQASEVVVHHSLGYAGTLDLVGKTGAYHWLIDLKTTAALSKAVALQTAAYRAAYLEKSKVLGPIRRHALRLTPDKYYLHPYTPTRDAADFASFVGFLKVHQWCSAMNAAFTPAENVSNG